MCPKVRSMWYLIDFKRSDWWMTPRLQRTGSAPVNSAATCLVAYSGAALDQVDRNAELTSARDLVDRKLAAMNGVAREVQYRRLAGMLSRRGFDGAVTTQVLADVLGA